MAGGSDEVDQTYSVHLVAANGREQAVALHIRRSGLWLYTQGGKEIQQLPYQHIVKWLPSKLRSRDPGPDDCLDVQVETTAGKKDLRMRCADVTTVQNVISDIRTTVQSVMSELGSKQQGASSTQAQRSAQENPASTQQSMQPARPPQQQASQKQLQVQAGQKQQQQPAVTAVVPQEQEQGYQEAPQQQQHQQRLPLQERQVQQVQQAQVDEPPLQQYSMKIAVPVEKPQQQQQQLDHATQQQQQTADLLTAAQQQLQHLFQQQPGGLASLQQQHHEQGQQEQLSPPAAAAPVQASSGAHNEFTARTGWTRASVDTTGIANRSSSSSPAAGSGSPVRHSHPKGARAFAPGALSPLRAALVSKETELDLSTAGAAFGVGASIAAVDLGRLGVGMAAAEGWQQVGAAAASAADNSDAAAQVRFLEQLVKRLSEELAARLAAEGPIAAQAALQAATSAAAGAGAVGDADLPLPPWMKDSRYLNPLLAAYDARLSAAQAEVAGRAQAAKDIQEQVNALVTENEALHDQLSKANARLANAAAASRVAAAAVTTDADRARFQERLELLETENDLLLAQQGELEEEIQRLGKLLQDKDSQAAQLQAAAAGASASAASLRTQLAQVERSTSDSRELREQVQELTAQLASGASRAAAAEAAADAAAAAQAAAQRELAAAQASSKTVQTLQAELARSRSAAEAAGESVSALRVEADSLRKALRAMEGRLAEYQAKDTEVYLRIKAAMELAEEARLERDAATSTTTALRQQLQATQARLADATKQLLGGSAADGGLGAAELRQKLAGAEREAGRAIKALGEAEAKVAELQASSAKLARDKASLTAELTTLRDELGCCCCGAGGSTSRSPVPFPIGTPGRMRAELLSDRLLDTERHRDGVMQRLDSCKRAAARAEKDWELERNNLHAEVQRLSRKVTAADAASTSAAAAAAESRQAAAEAELQTLRGAAAGVESELRAQLADSRAARDAEVSGLASKLERALAACDKAVSDAEEMLAGKDSLLGEWKKEAQLMSSKLETVLQQQAAEREEQQQVLQELSQQLTDTQDQLAWLQQELEGTRAACAEGDALLQETEGRVAAAQTAAVSAQEQAVQEVGGLQSQLERSQMEKLKAERQRDNLAAKLERMLASAPLTYRHPSTAAAASAAGDGNAAAAGDRDRRVSGWTSSSSDGSPGKAAAAAVAAAAGLMEDVGGQQWQQGGAQEGAAEHTCQQ